MSFQPSITLQGIEEAIQGLGYKNETALKYRLVEAIRGRYGENGGFSEPVEGIQAEELIRLLWSVDPDPDSLRSKKKNLSSIKSSINADLRRLYREGKNPEGITIGPENLFTISDDAKDDLLANFRTGGTAALQEIKRVSSILSGILSGDGLAGEMNREEMGADLRQIADLLKSLSEKAGLNGDAGPLQKGIEEFLKGAGALPLADEGESSDSAEVLGVPEGEFPEAGPGDLAPDADDCEEIVTDGTADLTGVSEGEVYEAFEEVEEEESFEDSGDFEIPELFSEGELAEPLEVGEDIDEAVVEADGGEELSEPLEEALEVEEDPGELEEGAREEYGDLEEAVVEADGGEGALPAIVEETEDAGPGGAEAGEEGAGEGLAEALEVEEKLGELKEGAPEEYDDIDEAMVEMDAGEDPAEALEVEEELGEEAPEEYLQSPGEEPEAGADAELLGEADPLDEVVDALEREGDAAEIEEEAPPEEEYDEDEEIVFDTGVGEGAPLDGGEEGTGGAAEHAPVQAISAGDRAGGTETADLGEARVLAEKFNGSLSEMDRFYNQYLFIPAGEYTIGSPDPREKGNPARRLRITQFYIGKFPVTNALFDVFVEKTGYRTTAERVGYGVVYRGRLQRKLNAKTGRESVTWNSSLFSRVVQGAFWYQPAGPGSNLHHKRNHPVVQVSLEDAMAFAAWTGKRLPTEEEWEAASRTMKGRLYPWGSGMRTDACNMETSAHGDTTPADRYLEYENEYGIADTLGNVLEWTTGKAGAQDDDGRGEVSFIAKGGSWVTARPVTLAARTGFGPESHSNILGFRCVAY